MIIYSREVAARVHEDIDPSKFATSIYYYSDASSGSYKLQLKNEAGTVLSEVDCADFISDGMVDNVEIIDDNLVISFNTDAGKQDISIPLSEIFDPSDYYTAEQTDQKINEEISNLDLGDAAGYGVDSSDLSSSSSKLPTSEVVTNELLGVLNSIKNSTITISNGYPASSVDSFTLNQASNKTINLGLNESAYHTVASAIPGNDTNALPTVSAVTSYISGLGYATTSQLPVVNNSTINIQRNSSDANPLTFTLNQSSNASLNLNLGGASECGVDSSIPSGTSSNLPTSDAVKGYVQGQGYVQSSSLGQAAYVGVDSSIPSGASSNLPTSDAVKAYTYSKAEVDDYIANVVYDDNTRTFTFTRGDGTSFTVTIS